MLDKSQESGNRSGTGYSPLLTDPAFVRLDSSVSHLVPPHISAV